MKGMSSVRVHEFEPGEFHPSFDGPVHAGRSDRTPEPGADRFLAPGHPFLRIGTWRAFVAGAGGSRVRLVASLDPRQQVGGGSVGAIGFIAAGDLREPSTRAALQSALEAAEAWLAAAGATVARCPVQFSTWYGHRTVTGGFPGDGGPTPFPMEPAARPGLAATLVTTGFTVAHRAASYRVAVDAWIKGACKSEERMRGAGYGDRPVRLEHFDDELATVHAISLASFRRSWGFSDITLDEFATIYRPFVRLIDPRLARIVESPDGEPVGFLFAFPDPATRAGHPDARFVGKTVAVLPEVCRATPGVGTGLIVAVHRAAAARGYGTAIHALVAEGAYSERVSARWGERFRSYATFEKVLP
jgi:hypothetical protein